LIALKTLLFTILVPGTVAVGIPYLLLTSGIGSVHDIGGFRFTGIVPIVLGIVFYIWTAGDFASIGRGTPAPIDPPRRLVSRGLYRIVRNPMYVGVLLILIGEVIFFGSLAILVYVILIWSVNHLFIIFYEEPTLSKKFGTAYLEYCKVVPRWVPRLKRNK
jgi:protein-S-isoprenylcysteine O-methyltransferase Ste14